MHAESDDLLNWTKTQDKLTFTPQEGYDPDDWAGSLRDLE